MKEFSAHQLKYYLDIKNNRVNPHCGRVPNSIEYWHVSDTEELFTDNLQKYPNSKHLQNYLKNPIEYKYNDHGFRTSDNFDLSGVGNVYLGCSHTFGIGHYLENTWSYKLSQKIGGKFYNISEPGSGIMTQYRYLKHFAPKINFKNVFHFLPEESWLRYEYFLNGNFDFLHTSEGHPIFEKYKDFILDVLYEEAQFMQNVFVYIDAIKNICKEYGSNYYLITNGFLQNIDANSTTMTPARDIQHYYVEEHDLIFNMFYDNYMNKKTSNLDRNLI